VQGRNREPFTESVNLQRQKQTRKVKSKVKSSLIILFDNKGIVYKEFVLAGKTVNSAYYCDVLWRLCDNALRLCSELWRQKNWLLYHSNSLFHTSVFTREFLIKNSITDQNQHDCRPPPTQLFSVCPIEDKTGRTPF
jgi:hypothetical protein